MVSWSEIDDLVSDLEDMKYEDKPDYSKMAIRIKELFSRVKKEGITD